MRRREKTAPTRSGDNEGDFTPRGGEGKELSRITREGEEMGLFCP